MIVKLAGGCPPFDLPDDRHTPFADRLREVLLRERRPVTYCHLAGPNAFTVPGQECEVPEAHCQHRLVPVEDERLVADERLA